MVSAPKKPQPLHEDSLKTKFKVGDLVSIIPVHSCLTVDKMKGFFVGEEKFSVMS